MSSEYHDSIKPVRSVRLRPVIALTLHYRSLFHAVAAQSLRDATRRGSAGRDDQSMPVLKSPFSPPHDSVTQSLSSASLSSQIMPEEDSVKKRSDWTTLPQHPLSHYTMSTSVGASHAFKHGKDDSEGNYIAVIGELFDIGRYEVVAQSGKGSFGQVVRAFDRVTREEVAIKIVRNKAQFYNQACVELRILQKLVALDTHNSNGIVHIRHYFYHQNHLCIVFELLSINLYELLSITQYTGVSLNLIRKFGQQLLTSLAFLARPEINIIHCDIKPENILLRDPKRSLIKLIDFGSSTTADQPNLMYRYVQSRYYRAPEVILGLPFSFPIDMWSLGCVLVEMHVGSPLFDGRNELDQLVKIMDYLGPPPSHMLAASSRMHKLCVQDLHGKIYFVPEFERCIQRRSLMDFIGVTTGGPRGMRLGQRGHSESDYFYFYDLIVHMLKYDPNERITPLAALEHPFFCKLRYPHPSGSNPLSQSDDDRP